MAPATATPVAICDGLRASQSDVATKINSTTPTTANRELSAGMPLPSKSSFVSNATSTAAESNVGTPNVAAIQNEVPWRFDQCASEFIDLLLADDDDMGHLVGRA